MAKTSRLKIICPVCKKSTELITLKYMETEDVPAEELEILENSDDLIQPDMTERIYHVVCHSRPNQTSSMSPTISRIKSHSIGLFKKRCVLSNLTARVFLYFYIDHEKQLAGYTFLIGKPLPNYDTK